MATTQPAHDQESLGDIGRQIADDAARLVRMEVELAKAGMVESLKRGAIAIALVAVAMPILLICPSTSATSGGRGRWRARASCSLR
jgi:hypothetical protein